MPVSLPLNKINKNGVGFTLIEVIMAIFLITIGAGGAFTIIQRTLAFTSVVSSQLTASYLAQEGIENIRNMRDGNWLTQRSNPGRTWDYGIASTDWQAVLDKFQRRITIDKSVADKMIVRVEVQWGERGGTHEVKAETELYNWRWK